MDKNLQLFDASGAGNVFYGRILAKSLKIYYAIHMRRAHFEGGFHIFLIIYIENADWGKRTFNKN